MVPAASFTIPGPVKVKLGVPSLSLIVPVPITGLIFCAVEAASVMFSGVSLITSSVVGTRTIKLIAPAGTLTVVPTNATKVTPPSKETNAGEVSVPRVAVPLARVSVTVVAVVLVLFKLTIKSRLPPSATAGLPTLDTCGRSSSPPGPVPIAPVPSSLIVVVTVPPPTATVALLGVFILTVKLSLPS